MCKGCGQKCGLVLLAIALALLGKDLGWWALWGINWWTLAFAWLGLCKLCAGSCKTCK